MKYTGVSLLYANGIGVQVLQEYERYGELYEDVQRVQEVSLTYLEIHRTCTRIQPLCTP